MVAENPTYHDDRRSIYAVSMCRNRSIFRRALGGVRIALSAKGTASTATPDPEAVSKCSSHGCIRLLRPIRNRLPSLLNRAAHAKRDRGQVIYAGGLHTSNRWHCPANARSERAKVLALARAREIDAMLLTELSRCWADVLMRDERVRRSITGKTGKVRQVLVPEVVSGACEPARGPGASHPGAVTHSGGGSLLPCVWP
jgi:hypothetical protein